MAPFLFYPLAMYALKPISKAHCSIALAVVVFSIICTYWHSDLFFYQRSAIETGQYWRLFSGHFAHLNHLHLILNMAAWVIIFLLGSKILSCYKWLVLLVVYPLAISLLFYFFVPEVTFYGGLSGVLHGIFLTILFSWARQGSRIAFLISVAIIVKVLYETFFQDSFLSDQLLNIEVVTEAHFFGAVIAITLAAVSVLAPQFFPLRTRKLLLPL